MEIKKYAELYLSKRLNGESPDNDMTNWEERAVVAMKLFREGIKDALTSMEMGRITVQDAQELIDASARGIDALLYMNGDI